MALRAVAGTAAPLLGEPLPVELMNTVWADRDGLHDELRDAAGLAAWLQAVAGRFAAGAEGGGPGATGGGPGLAVALPGGRPGRELAGQFRELRDGLRGLAAAVTGDPRARAAGTGTRSRRRGPGGQRGVRPGAAVVPADLGQSAGCPGPDAAVRGHRPGGRAELDRRGGGAAVHRPGRGPAAGLPGTRLRAVLRPRAPAA